MTARSEPPAQPDSKPKRNPNRHASPIQTPIQSKTQSESHLDLKSKSNLNLKRQKSWRYFYAQNENERSFKMNPNLEARLNAALSAASATLVTIRRILREADAAPVATQEAYLLDAVTNG